jgi:hypothetical protein
MIAARLIQFNFRKLMGKRMDRNLVFSKWIEKEDGN